MVRLDDLAMGQGGNSVHRGYHAQIVSLEFDDTYSHDEVVVRPHAMDLAALYA